MVDIGPEEKAEMVMLNGIGYDYAEVAEYVGCAESTVGTYINEFEAEAESSDDPKKVAAQILLEGVGMEVLKGFYG